MTTPIYDVSTYLYHFTGHFEISSLILFLCFTYLLYYLTNIRHKPELRCSRYGKLRNLLTTYVEELNKDYFPLIWCPRPLLMTLLHSLFGHTIHFNFQRYCFSVVFTYFVSSENATLERE